MLGVLCWTPREAQRYTKGLTDKHTDRKIDRKTDRKLGEQDDRQFVNNSGVYLSFVSPTIYYYCCICS